MLAKEVSGEPVLFLKLAGNLYAYRDVCPGCGTSLEQGELRVADLTCSGCGRRYDARRAGDRWTTPRSCTWSPSRCSWAKTAR